MKMTIPFHKTSWVQGQKETRDFYVDASLWPTQDRRKVLRGLAKEWGEINVQQTIISNDTALGILFSCAGHGGLIVFSTEKIENWQADWSCEDYKYSDGRPYKFPASWYIYRYEEDCAWAVAYLEMTEAQRRKWDGDHDSERMLEFARKSVESYFPDIEIKPNRWA